MRMYCLCYDIGKWLGILVSDGNDNPYALSPVSSLYWLAGNVKEPMRLLQREGNIAPGVVI